MLHIRKCSIDISSNVCYRIVAIVASTASLRGGWGEIVVQIGRLSSIEKFVGNTGQSKKAVPRF